MPQQAAAEEVQGDLAISAASEIAKKYQCRQVIILAWDGKTTHVVTYGKSSEDCAQAAAGGNRLKRALGWPATLCNTIPHRIKRMKETIRTQAAEIRALKGEEN